MAWGKLVQAYSDAPPQRAIWRPIWLQSIRRSLYVDPCTQNVQKWQCICNWVVRISWVWAMRMSCVYEPCEWVACIDPLVEYSTGQKLFAIPHISVNRNLWPDVYSHKHLRRSLLLGRVGCIFRPPKKIPATDIHIKVYPLCSPTFRYLPLCSPM